MYSLNSQEAEAVVRAIEAATRVKRGFQFFVWLQSHLHSLIPHELAVCGAYHRPHRDLSLEAFNSTVVPPSALVALTDPMSPLLRYVIAAGPARSGQAMRIDLTAPSAGAAGVERDVLVEQGLSEIIVHGVSRPQRPTELETLFLLLDRGSVVTDRQIAHFELLLPHLHATYLRVRATEREVGTVATAVMRKPAGSTETITRRERQILACVREGKSNLEIGESLEISALTVKNHIQKVLRKLGASNRTHAVSRAVSLGLIDSSDDMKGGREDPAPATPGKAHA